MDLETALRGTLPPLLAALLLVSWRGARMLPLAMGVGLFVAFVLLKKQWPAWPHELYSQPNGSEWLLWALVAAALVALLEHAKVLPARFASSLGAATAAFGLLLVVEKVRAAQEWASGDVWLFVGGGGAIAAFAVASQRVALARAPRSIWPAVLWAIVLSVDAGIIVNGNSAFLAQLCGAVAAAVGAAAGTMLWRRPFALSAADGVWLGAAHTLFVLSAVHLAYLEWTPALVALGAPLLLLALPRGVGGKAAWRWFAVAAPLVLVPLGVALWLSVPEVGPYGY